MKEYIEALEKNVKALHDRVEALEKRTGKLEELAITLDATKRVEEEISQGERSEP